MRKTEADNGVEMANTGCLRPEVHLQAMLAVGWQPGREHVYYIVQRKVARRQRPDRRGSALAPHGRYV